MREQFMRKDGKLWYPNCSSPRSGLGCGNCSQPETELETMFMELLVGTQSISFATLLCGTQEGIEGSLC